MSLHTPTASAAVLPAGLPLLDRPAAAELANVSPSTVQRWRRTGVLPVVRFGTRVLYRRASILAYLDALTAPQPGAARYPGAPTPATPSRRPEAVVKPLSQDDAATLLPLDDVRALLSIGTTTLGLALSSGELPSVRVHTRRMVRAGDLAAYVDAHTEPAVTGPLAGSLA